MTPRYGQLSYTSFDAAGTAGGWQVKQTAGRLADDEVRALVSGVQTVFHPPQPPPTYPTPEQLAGLPRRLAYRRLDGDAAAYWHSVPAGADATGRPGNVFAHVLLDRAAEPRPGHRPIQLWRSPGWLCPYGKAAVAAAQLPADPPGPAPVVTHDSVIDFALGSPTWRLGVLCGLLDAVAAAMDGGPSVLLGVGSMEAGAQWIGLVSFLMSPGTARALSFSTFERAEQLGPALRAGQQLTAIPRQDLARTPGGVVVIDEAELLSLGELGGQPHRTASGQLIEVTAWSAMAQVALLDVGSARLLLSDIDMFAAQLPDVGLHPAWPMAMSALTRAEFADAAAEARSVIAAHAPPDADPASLPARAVHDVVAAVGASTADAWAALQQMPGGPAGDLAAAVYLRRAITDATWLDQLGPVPLVGTVFAGRAVPADLAAAVGPALAAARADGPDRLVRLVDLLIRAGVADGVDDGVDYSVDDGVDDGVAAALRADVAPVLCDPVEGPRLVRRLGRRVGGRCRLAAAAAVLRGSRFAAGCPVGDAVLDWLAEGVTVPGASQLAAATPWDDVWLAAALAGLRAARRGPAGARERSAGLWWLRVGGGSPGELARMAGFVVWDPADLLAAAGDAALPAPATIATLSGAPPSAGLAELASKVVAANDDDTAVACAAVRLIEPRQWVAQGYVEAYQAAYTPHWQQAITALGPGRVGLEMAVRLLVLAVVAVVAGEPYPPAVAALAGAEARSQALAQLVEMVEGLVVIPAAVLAAGLLRSGGDEPLGRRANNRDEPLGRRANNRDEPLGRRANNRDEPLGRRANNRDGESEGGGGAVEELLRALGREVAGARLCTGEQADAVAELMTRMAGGAGAAGGAEMRRFRKMAQKLLTGPAEGQPSLAARLRRSR